MVELCMGMIYGVFSICNVHQYYEKWLLASSISHHICPHRS